MATGAGTMSAGLGPCGLATPVPGSDPPAQGSAAGVRYINPATKSYEIDAQTKQFAQMPSVRQRFLLALSTTQGSSSVQSAWGTKLPRKLGPKAKAEIEAAIRSAVVQLTDVERVARIDAIIIERGSSNSGTTRVRPTVSFTDLTTGQAFTDTI